MEDMTFSVGSVCSGIEAASVALCHLGFKFCWFSEIANFPSRLLANKYPHIPNLGNMEQIPDLLLNGKIDAPDMICGGTPCQAFSTAGWKQGLNDNRGNLTLKFVEIANANDTVRALSCKPQSLILWENVEGVLADKTNAFGCFISSLAGLKTVLPMNGRWPSSGILNGPARNVVWRVLDAKYFGIPQQRKRLYLLAGHPLYCNIGLIKESNVFETYSNKEYKVVNSSYSFCKDNVTFELFRTFTDCLFSSYATKWNGNASANNGSLFVVQDMKIRRFSPLECERLMGFPDNYTKIDGAKKSQRYNALGNSWSVPVIKWLGERIKRNLVVLHKGLQAENSVVSQYETSTVIDIKLSDRPKEPVLGDLRNIVTHQEVHDIYISPVGCAGILRRSKERMHCLNTRLREVLTQMASTMDSREIERKSRVQKRGRFSMECTA